ncbi:polysaccharide deacetylase family protein [Streptacidiphilus sp. N1-12]|uniref:Polysaccharide deacetylase family protein n=2 Tax=Streptacidiphilus alkalitolerans TaxID=3342712 RepID=A0ABV6W9S2_9ACTN
MRQQQPRNRASRSIRRTGTAAVVLAATLLGLAGCDGYDSTSPATARAHASGVPAAFATGAAGSVDCREAKCVALTFDTGPSPQTPKILALLRQYHIHATFFLRGDNALKYADFTRQTAAEGNELETLTWNHHILTRISKEEVRDEIVRGREAVAKVTGITPTLLRPPQGRTSDTVTGIARDLGMAEVEWSATGSDYATNDSQLIADRILKDTRRDGIILLHDWVDPTNRGYNGTVASIPLIVAKLQSEGYTFVTVSQLLAPGKPQAGKVYK